MENFYRNYLFKLPYLFLTIFIVGILFFGSYGLKLNIDANSDSLILKNDKALISTNELQNSFGVNDFLLLTYNSDKILINEQDLKNIKLLSEELLKINGITSVNSILNVPLLENKVVDISKIDNNFPTLETEGVSYLKAIEEFKTSSLYSNNLISSDLKTTGLVLNIKNIDNLETTVFEKQLIFNIREVTKKFNFNTHLGGVSMIKNDMISFVKNDLKTFGIIVLLIIGSVLLYLFKRPIYVFAPILLSFTSVAVTSGILKLFDYSITVISNNFISLLIIINMSLVVHIIVKYNEVNESNLFNNFIDKFIEVYKHLFTPSFFVVITTIIGFGSLIFSNILPVVNFGFMMSIGIVISFIFTFTVLPLLLFFVDKNNNQVKTFKEKIIHSDFISNTVFKYSKSIIFISILVIGFSVSGFKYLIVENSFISYFKTDTEIYKGMKVIDEKLGGTTPLDIILTFKEVKDNFVAQIKEDTVNSFMDDFEEEFSVDESEEENYFVSKYKLETIKNIHEYLESIPEIGKVLSLNTLNLLVKKINNNEDLNGLTFNILQNNLDDKQKNILINPYLNIEKNQVRFNTRVIDSNGDLRRNELIEKIEKDLNLLINKEFEEIEVTNLLVIYNNLLQSLFDSQIKTIGFVICVIFIMFVILFRNFKLSLVAIFANIVPVSIIFGIMGWYNIPLDIMTITIVAISMGIAVDNTIHFIYRTREEYEKNNDYDLSVKEAHKGIGKAMFYTSIVIMFGFIVLTLSNFTPTIYFGFLTVIAMFMAILSDLFLLPVLMKYFKVFK